MSYDIELNELEILLEDKARLNNQSIKESLEKIEEILNDIDKRLKDGNI